MNLKLVYFSPTHTSEKIAKSVAEGMKIKDYEIFDITHPINGNVEIKEDDLTIFAVPTYGGRIPSVAVERLKLIKGNNTPSIIIALFGNMNQGDSLIELRDVIISQKFHPMAGAFFIGEHSFITEKYSVALGRPDKSDLKKASNFGAEIISCMSSLTKNNEKLSVPGNFPYKPLKSGNPVAPTTDENLCTLCGHCIDICPVDAISKVNDKIITDANLCIKCCACVKECPENARIFEFSNNMAKILYERNGGKRKEPELFFLK